MLIFFLATSRYDILGEDISTCFSSTGLPVYHLYTAPADVIAVAATRIVIGPILSSIEMQSLSDSDARIIEQVWKQAFPSSTILPVIGYPSHGNGVMTLTHQIGLPPMNINGLISQSPLANNALYTAEITGGKFMNLYEVMIPDLPGRNGSLSTGQLYINTLGNLDIDSSASHYHWTGVDHAMMAIHHQNIGMNPVEFSRRTIRAIKTVLPVIKQRLHRM